MDSRHRRNGALPYGPRDGRPACIRCSRQHVGDAHEAESSAICVVRPTAWNGRRSASRVRGLRGVLRDVQSGSGEGHRCTSRTRSVLSELGRRRSGAILQVRRCTAGALDTAHAVRRSLVDSGLGMGARLVRLVHTHSAAEASQLALGQRRGSLTRRALSPRQRHRQHRVLRAARHRLIAAARSCSNSTESCAPKTLTPSRFASSASVR